MLNRNFKDDLNTFRANITPQSVAKSSRPLASLTHLIDTFDRQLHVKHIDGQHVGPSLRRDFNLVLDKPESSTLCLGDSMYTSRTLKRTPSTT